MKQISSHGEIFAFALLNDGFFCHT